MTINTPEPNLENLEDKPVDNYADDGELLEELCVEDEGDE